MLRSLFSLFCAPQWAVQSLICAGCGLPGRPLKDSERHQNYDAIWGMLLDPGLNPEQPKMSPRWPPKQLEDRFDREKQNGF